LFRKHLALTSYSRFIRPVLYKLRYELLHGAIQFSLSASMRSPTTNRTSHPDIWKRSRLFTCCSIFAVKIDIYKTNFISQWRLSEGRVDDWPREETWPKVKSLFMLQYNNQISRKAIVNLELNKPQFWIQLVKFIINNKTIYNKTIHKRI